MSQSECKACDGLGQIVVGGPYCQGPFQPPEYETEVCDMCGGSGQAEQPEAVPEKTRFDNLCTCGGYAYSMNERPIEQPHMSWCPQAAEYAEWFAAQKRKEGGGK